MKIKRALANFPKKFLFVANGQFRPNLANNYGTIYLMIRFNNLFKTL